MAKSAIVVKGVGKVNKNMNAYARRVDNIINNEAQKLVVNVVADGQRLAHVDTGFMRANIVVQVRRSVYRAITKAIYSSPVDKRFPFFTDQAKKKLSKFIPKIRSIIRGL